MTITPTPDPKYVIIDNRLCNARTREPIPDDEPVFILRAKDRKAHRAIRGYASSCEDERHQELAFERAEAFKVYGKTKPTKEPDTGAPS